MPKVAPAPGETVVTRTEQTVVPAKLSSREEIIGADIWQTMANIDAQNKWDDYSAVLYRSASGNPSANDWRQIKKFQNSFDDDYVRQTYGGGAFRIWLKADKRGKEIIQVAVFETEGHRKQINLDGEVIDGAASTNGDGGAIGVLDKLVDRLTNSPLLNEAAKNALEMQKTAFVETLKSVSGNNQPPAVNPAALMMEGFRAGIEMMKAVTPAAGGVTGHSSSISELKEILAFTRELQPVADSGSSGGIAGTLVDAALRALPTLGQYGLQMMREYRAASENNLRAVSISRGVAPPPVHTVEVRPQPPANAGAAATLGGGAGAPAAPSAGAAASVPPSAVDAQSVAQNVEAFQRTVVKLLADETLPIEQVVSFVDAQMPEVVDQMRGHNVGNVLGFLRAFPILSPALDTPRGQLLVNKLVELANQPEDPGEKLPN